MDVKLPPLGEGADTGTVVNVFVKEGDIITKGQAILELENEKAVATIPSSSAGTVSKVYVKSGDKIAVGHRLIALGDGAAPAVAAPVKAAAPRNTRDEEPEPIQTPHPEPGVPVAPPAAEPTVETFPVPATSPSIRKLSRDLGIDLTKVRGSQRGGRIVMEDVRSYIQRLQRLASQPKAAAEPGQPKQVVAESIDFSKWGPVSKKPMSSLRQIISRRMTENWNAIPHVTQFDDADITALNELRKKHAAAYEAKGTRLTLTPFVVKAVAETLKKHPIFNSSLDEASQEIVLKEYVHIGIAVDTEAGLIVPVIRDADRKSILEISRELEDLARRARDRKVSGDELKGGTFTISNQGGIGGAHFTPIINKPEVAILGLGRGALKAVVRGGNIEPRLMMPIGLSYDHRVIDGGIAARFTVDLIKAIEQFRDEDAVLA